MKRDMVIIVNVRNVCRRAEIMTNICKKRDYHNWCGDSGNSANSSSESYTEMDVRFTCEDCGAVASGTVYWEKVEE